MWEAVTAVFSVCVRAGRGGVYTGLGELTHLLTYLLSDARKEAREIADGPAIGDLGNIFLTMSSAAAAAAGIESLPGNASSLEATA